MRSPSDAVEVIREGLERITGALDLNWQLVKYLILSRKSAEAEEVFLELASENPMGINYFLEIFPQALQIPNIAGLIEIYEKAH
jgi:hypothetical protein